ncbi:MAG TPA: PilZ domain-containing protein [Devosia sp.]|nr:PilZ domain-containing protein [Devosia sp.]
MEALAEPVVIEQRRAPRFNVLKRAKVAFDQGFSSADCIIRNISESGAKLRFAALERTVPDNFDLICTGSPVQNCKVVWRRVGEMGVQFQ